MKKFFLVYLMHPRYQSPYFYLYFFSSVSRISAHVAICFITFWSITFSLKNFFLVLIHCMFLDINIISATLPITSFFTKSLLFYSFYLSFHFKKILLLYCCFVFSFSYIQFYTFNHDYFSRHVT